MKTLITQIVMAFATLVAITACRESNVSDLQLGGDCNVQALALDKYRRNGQHQTGRPSRLYHAPNNACA